MRLLIDDVDFLEAFHRVSDMLPVLRSSVPSRER